MPEQLSPPQEDQIITCWLRGMGPTEIAKAVRVSRNSVYRVLGDFENRIGKPRLKALEILAKEIRAASSNASECAYGFRLLNILKSLGAPDHEESVSGNADDSTNKLKSFLAVLYENLVIKSNISQQQAERVADTIKESLTLSEKLGMPFVQVPSYIEEASKTKEQLDADLKLILDEIKKAQKEQADALLTKEVAARDLDQYVYVRGELKKNYNLSTTDLPKLANLLKNAAELNYSPTLIFAKASSIESLEKKEKELNESIGKLIRGESDARRSYESTQNKLFESGHFVHVYKKLRSMNIGTRELETLHNALESLSRANNVSTDEVFKIFFNDLEEHYPQTLHFKIILEKTKQSLKEKEEELGTLEMDYSNKKKVIDALEVLLSRGFKEQDVLCWQSVLQKYYQTNSESLLSDLESYGSVKQSVQKLAEKINELDKKERELRPTVEGLQQQKQMLGKQIQILADDSKNAIASVTEKSKANIESLVKISEQNIEKIGQEAISFGASARDEIRSIKDEVLKQHKEVINLQGFTPFLPIVKATIGDQDVNFYSLAQSVSKAIAVILPRVSDDDLLTRKALVDAQRMLRNPTPNLSQ